MKSKSTTSLKYFKTFTNTDKYFTFWANVLCFCVLFFACCWRHPVATHTAPASSLVFVCKVFSDELLLCACSNMPTLKIGRTVRASPQVEQWLHKFLYQLHSKDLICELGLFPRNTIHELTMQMSTSRQNPFFHHFSVFLVVIE